MLTRLLVLLGETPSSVTARRYAFRLARGAQAELAGLAGVDLTTIEAPMIGRVGASAFKAALEAQLKKHADEIRQRLRQTYERECAVEGVSFEWLSFRGDPLETLHLATETRDLAVTGHDTGFSGGAQQPLSEFLADVLVATPRPVVVCPDELPAGSATLVAYDGSVSAMRVIQMFALLGLGRDQPLRVVSIDPVQENAARKAASAAAYLRGHGYQAETNPIESSVHPAEVLRIEIASARIGTLIMGAYGRRGFREFLFGSTSRTLVENPPCALFLYH